jgi:hypothetical protein
MVHRSVTAAAQSVGKQRNLIGRAMRLGTASGGFLWSCVSADPEIDAHIDDLVETVEGL